MRALFDVQENQYTRAGFRWYLGESGGLSERCQSDKITEISQCAAAITRLGTCRGV